MKIKKKWRKPNIAKIIKRNEERKKFDENDIIKSYGLDCGYNKSCRKELKKIGVTTNDNFKPIITTPSTTNLNSKKFIIRKHKKSNENSKVS